MGNSDLDGIVAQECFIYIKFIEHKNIILSVSLLPLFSSILLPSFPPLLSLSDIGFHCVARLPFNL